MGTATLTNNIKGRHLTIVYHQKIVPLRKMIYIIRINYKSYFGYTFHNFIQLILFDQLFLVLKLEICGVMEYFFQIILALLY